MYRNYDPDKERANVAKLKRQLKKEQRGARRELKKDAHFIETEKYNKTLENIQEREANRKKILGMLQQQQAEFNQLEKLKKKKGGNPMKKKSAF
jgi:nucleolar protein 14